MSKPTLEERIHDYLDGRLSPDERATFEASLKRDSELAARVDEYRGIGDALRESDGSLSPEFFARTRLRFEEQSRARAAPRWFRLLSWETAGLLAAAGLAAVLFVPFLWQEESLPYETPTIPDKQVVLAAPPAPAERDDAFAEGEIDRVDADLAEVERPVVAADALALEPEDRPAAAATEKAAAPKESAAGRGMALDERLGQAAAPRTGEKKGQRVALRSEQLLKDEANEQPFQVTALPEGIVPRGEVRITPDDLAKRKRDQTDTESDAYRQEEAGWRRVRIGAGPRLLDCDTVTVTHADDGWRIRVEESDSGSVGCEVRLPGTGGPVEVERIAVDGR